MPGQEAYAQVWDNRMNRERTLLADEDAALVTRFQRGEAAVFDTLFTRHQDYVYNIVYGIVGNAEESRDLTQEVFVQVYRSLPRFRNSARFGTWLYTIARNLCIDHARKRALRNHPSLDEGAQGPTLGERTADPAANVEQAASAAEIRRRVLTAVDALPEEQREVFLLREISNLPFKEIAQVVGIPENTVKSRMRYALERLQAALSDFEEYARALR